jgi:predicted DNA-binding transcriptional regulator AlpA
MSAQVEAAKKAAKLKAENAPRAQARAMANMPGLRKDEPPAAAPSHIAHDDQHVHGARGPPKTTGPLRVWVRINDIKAAGIAASWTQLYRLIRDQGFPAGKLIGRNTRAWDAQEIEAWVDSRPDFDEQKQEHSRKARAKRDDKRHAAEAQR